MASTSGPAKESILFMKECRNACQARRQKRREGRVAAETDHRRRAAPKHQDKRLREADDGAGCCWRDCDGTRVYCVEASVGGGVFVDINVVWVASIGSARVCRVSDGVPACVCTFTEAAWTHTRR